MRPSGHRGGSPVRAKRLGTLALPRSWNSKPTNRFGIRETRRVPPGDRARRSVVAKKITGILIPSPLPRIEVGALAWEGFVVHNSSNSSQIFVVRCPVLGLSSLENPRILALWSG